MRMLLGAGMILALLVVATGPVRAQTPPPTEAAAEEAPADPEAPTAPPGPAGQQTDPGPWALPEPGSCSPAGGLRGHPFGEDAPPLRFTTGDVIDAGKLEVLKDFLPAEVWEQREKFFFDGMRLEIGPCFRDYGPPAFYRRATEAHAGTARLTEDGGLEGHLAGLPFPPGDIAPDDPQAGAKWAWNFEHRYQGAGFRGRFRISDLVGRTGRAEPFEGEIFKLHVAHRADKQDGEYRSDAAPDKQWVVGGLFFEPFAAREFAWRQYRDLESQTRAQRSDDLHAYLPEWRRVRRINSARVEGIYMPSFSVGVQQNQQVVIGGGGGAAAGGVAAAGSVGATGGSITPRRSGFEGLVMRPQLYQIRVLGLRDVLAPLNATVPAYPENPDRDFGPWGLSWASDTWDLRRALVLEGTAREARGGDQTARFVQYVDLQTLAPLYYMAFDSKGELMDVGYYVGRWSEDREDYPRWPDDPERPVRTVDPVGAAFANLAESGSWRRESWDVVATPPDEDRLERLLSVGMLTRRR